MPLLPLMVFETEVKLALIELPRVVTTVTGAAPIRAYSIMVAPSPPASRLRKFDIATISRSEGFAFVTWLVDRSDPSPI